MCLTCIRLFMYSVLLLTSLCKQCTYGCGRLCQIVFRCGLACLIISHKYCLKRWYTKSAMLFDETISMKAYMNWNNSILFITYACSTQPSIKQPQPDIHMIPRSHTLPDIKYTYINCILLE